MATDNVSSININSLSTAHRKQIQALRRPVLDAAKTFGKVRERLTDLAPKVVKLFNSIIAEDEGITFVEFCRMFDASVPSHAADRDGTTGYRNHPTYYTLQYMRRLVQAARTGRRGQQGVRDSATDALARTLATILQLVPDGGDAPIWDAIQSEFQFGERIMTRLRQRVEATKPLIKLEVSRPAKIGNVIHMERLAAPAATDNANPLAQPGQRVRVARTRAA